MQSPPEGAKKLPVSALLALAMTGFICILTETIPAGLLPQISQSLAVSPSLAGQMVTAYAAGSLLLAIPLTLLTRSWPGRRVLLLTVLGFLVFNSLTAISGNVTMIMFARFMAGACAGLAWSLLAGFARRIVMPSLQGRALAIAMAGTPVALSLGVPAGTWMGELAGWRLTFAIMSGLSLLLTGWIMLSVPKVAAESESQQTTLRTALLVPGVRPVLVVVLGWMLAHNILYTYITPFIAPAGLAPRVDLVLLVFGLTALAGIVMTGYVVDRYLRQAVLLSVAGFALVALLFSLYGTSAPAIYGGTALWGLTFGGAATLLQTALADASGKHADVALSLNVVTWNSAIALGGVCGGLLLRHGGSESIPRVLLLLLLITLGIVWRAGNHGFPAGSRGSR
ncbi:MFS transporter [Tatumella morbirosei]|uniref:MFS transporter n=1 Tax=Tatumella morbirosei TaxID=642227 RepID=A0A095VZP8_9GAMM|nr:MFS transporter [Tatumella morbirosei]KGD80165.1 MFS transporter [Tatumella morbirosei]